MFVAASTECFAKEDFDTAMQRLVDLEFSRVEICVHEGGNQIKPSFVRANLEEAITMCRAPHRLTPIAYSLEIPGEGPDYYDQFTACCKLAKATKVVSVTVPSGELGTPFNAEIERLRELVRIGSLEGVNVSIRTDIGCMSQDPDTAVVLCNNVKGLGLTLDPSTYTCGPHSSKSYDHVFAHVYHLRLRDTSRDQRQVRVGQGQIEYSRLISQLAKYNYNRALCVHMSELPDVDHFAEMRKMRLLLESLLS